MLGALIFGACYHYLIISPDHVAHLPPGDARSLFRTTALLLEITEICKSGAVAVARLDARRTDLRSVLSLPHHLSRSRGPLASRRRAQPLPHYGVAASDNGDIRGGRGRDGIVAKPQKSTGGPNDLTLGHPVLLSFCKLAATTSLAPSPPSYARTHSSTAAVN